MTPSRITRMRTLGEAWGKYLTPLIVSLFVAVCAAAFTLDLKAADGGEMPLSAVWALGVSRFLPALSAFLAMGLWSGERKSGRIDLLLSSPVRERSFVVGKFLGACESMLFSLLLVFVATMVPLAFVAPSAISGIWLFLGAFFVLAMQGALWCALTSFASAVFPSAAVAACSSFLVSYALPRCGWYALLALHPRGPSAFGEMPLDAHVVDFASGCVSTGAIAFYAAMTGFCLFATSKTVALMRLHGRRSAGLRFSTRASIALSFVLAVLVSRLAFRLDIRADALAEGFELSGRTRDILSESGGEISATCFMSRGDVRFRQVNRVLRAFAYESSMLGGAGITLRFVDPNWNVGEAGRLSRSGVPGNSVVWEKGYRRVVLPIDDGFDERGCASSVQRLTTPPQRRMVYWTAGHGEIDFDDYGLFGMSDIARDLVREGFVNARLDLAAGDRIPSDCALVVVAGPEYAFSRDESDRIDSYLRHGGRLLAMFDSADYAFSLLPAWGIRLSDEKPASAGALAGAGAVACDFGDHPVSRPLRGSRLMLENPVAFRPSSAVESGVGADKIGFWRLANAGDSAVAVAAERGAGAGADVAIRPTRIVAIGDAGLAINGNLAVHGNANRDFFLNCVAYLAGIDAVAASGVEVDRLQTGMDRSDRLRLAYITVGAIPFALLLALAAAVAVRRRRK